LAQYDIEYYNDERVHTSIADAPFGRASETKPSGRARVIRLPRVGVFKGAIRGARLPERADEF